MVAMTRASPRKRSMKPGSSSSADWRIFTATVRPSTVSSAFHTSPMPPVAIRSSSRYRPPRVPPGVSMTCVPSLRGVGSLNPQHRLHDLAADDGGVAAAVLAGPLEEHAHGHLRVAGILVPGVSHEPAVLAADRAVLGGAGLAAHLVAVDLGLGTGAVL